MTEKIFWAEADDDAIRMDGQDVARSALIAYLLLRKQVVIHPAYIWQSRQTHEMILGSGSNEIELLSPPHLNVLLSDLPSVEEYITDRQSKLQREFSLRKGDIPGLHQYARSELDQYADHGKNLIRDSVALDEKFTANENAILRVTDRDDRFRRTVQRDLEDKTSASSLYGLILRNRERRNSKDVVEKLTDRAKNKEILCSVDSLMAIPIEEGFAPRTDKRTSIGILNRLRVLYWDAYNDPGLHVPIIKRGLYGSIDPYDHKVFWAAMDYFIGKYMRNRLLHLPLDEACGKVTALTENEKWLKFVSVYEQIVETLNFEDEETYRERIRIKLSNKYPAWHKELLCPPQNKFQLFLLLLGISASIGGAGPIAAVVGTIPTIYGIPWKEIKERYTDNELRTLKKHIRNVLE